MAAPHRKKPTGIKMGRPGVDDRGHVLVRDLPADDAPRIDWRCDHPPVMPPVVAEDLTAAAEWQRILRVSPPALYSALDTQLLASYCLAVAARDAVVEAARSEPHLLDRISANSGEVVARYTNPIHMLAKSCIAAVLHYGMALGISPNHRQRAALAAARATPPTKQEPIKTPFDDLLGGLGDVVRDDH